MGLEHLSYRHASARRYNRGNKNKDSKLSASEIKKIKSVELYDGYSAIKSLKGVENFTELQTLVVCGTSIEALDLRKNTKLSVLDISGTPMKTLKITGLKKLKWVDATSKSLASLDIAGCTKLLQSVKQPWSFEGDTVDWYGNALFWTSINTRLMNGSKLLRQYARPKSISFSKKTLTVRKGQEGSLYPLLKMNPSTSYYPVTFTSSNEEIFFICDPDASNWYEYVALKKGSVTVTAKCGSKKATIKVTVK